MKPELLGPLRVPPDYAFPDPSAILLVNLDIPKNWRIYAGKLFIRRSALLTAIKQSLSTLW